jgi:hypothetical protein
MSVFPLVCVCFGCGVWCVYVFYSIRARALASIPLTAASHNFTWIIHVFIRIIHSFETLHHSFMLCLGDILCFQEDTRPSLRPTHFRLLICIMTPLLSPLALLILILQITLMYLIILTTLPTLISRTPKLPLIPLTTLPTPNNTTNSRLLLTQIIL